MSCSAASDERFRWRPWPCADCRQGTTPVGYILGRHEASSTLPSGIPEEIATVQAAWLQEWSCPHCGDLLFNFPKLTEGSEHAVYFDENSATVYKLTLLETYGDFYYIDETGRVCQEKCTPLQYLVRLHVWDKLFGLAPVPIGITANGRILSYQSFISGEAPSQEMADEYLESNGLLPVKINCWLWKRAYPEFDVWIGDARADNFVQTKSGIVPIDLRVWFSPPDSNRPIY